MKIISDRHDCAIYCQPAYGPTFGVGDIIICSNANTNTDSYSRMGHSFTHPQYAAETDVAQSFLAGSYEFKLSEIEVYQKE